MRQIILLLWVLSAQSVATEIYTWVDDAGVRHFAAQPPAGQAAKALDPHIGPLWLGNGSPADKAAAPEATDSDPRQQLLNKQVKQQVATEQANLEKLCSQWRASVAQLENNPRIRVEQDGQMRRISEEERQKYLTDIKAKITEYCP